MSFSSYDDFTGPESDLAVEFTASGKNGSRSHIPNYLQYLLLKYFSSVNFMGSRNATIRNVSLDKAPRVGLGTSHLHITREGSDIQHPR